MELTAKIKNQRSKIKVTIQKSKLKNVFTFAFP